MYLWVHYCVLGSLISESYLNVQPHQLILNFFPSPLAFCKKAVERVNSEKNILNSSVEWSGFF